MTTTITVEFKGKQFTYRPPASAQSAIQAAMQAPINSIVSAIDVDALDEEQLIGPTLADVRKFVAKEMDVPFLDPQNYKFFAYGQAVDDSEKLTFLRCADLALRPFLPPSLIEEDTTTRDKHNRVKTEDDDHPQRKKNRVEQIVTASIRDLNFAAAIKAQYRRQHPYLMGSLTNLRGGSANDDGSGVPSASSSPVVAVKTGPTHRASPQQQPQQQQLQEEQCPPLGGSGRSTGDDTKKLATGSADFVTRQDCSVLLPGDDDASRNSSLTSASATTTPTMITLPIIIGNRAEKLTGIDYVTYEHTHRYTAYVRGMHNEDIGSLVEKVMFVLHRSYLERGGAGMYRTVTQPPFEFTETSYGNFELKALVFFRHVDAPITLSHFLHFLPPLDISNSKNLPKPHSVPPRGVPVAEISYDQPYDYNAHTPIPVVGETIDEIVFCNPSEQLRGLLERHNINANKDCSSPPSSNAAPATSSKNIVGGVSCWSDILIHNGRLYEAFGGANGAAEDEIKRLENVLSELKAENFSMERALECVRLKAVLLQKEVSEAGPAAPDVPKAASAPSNKKTKSKRN